MSKDYPRIPLGEAIQHRSEFIEIDDFQIYKRCRVQLHAQGIVERDVIPGAEIKTKQQRVCRANEFLVAEIDAKLGGFGIVPDSLDGAIVSSHYFLFTINESLLNRHFLGFFIRTPAFMEQVQAKGSTNYAAIRPSDVLKYEIPLPPLQEQQRIVARIEELAAKIDEARGLYISINSDIYRTLLSAYNTIMKDAKYLLMRDVAPLERRPIEVKPEEEYFELGIRSFGKGTFHKPSITGASLGTKRIFSIEEGDLLFNIVFAWEGAVAIAQPEDRGRVGSHRFLTCVPKKDLATPFFLRFHFLTDEGLQQLLDASPGSAGRNRTLGIKALEGLQVPIPPLKKQQWFDSLQERFNLARHFRGEALVELDAVLPSVLDKAFKGEL